MTYRKQYIRVDVSIDENGTMRPQTVHWTDDRCYEVTRIKRITPAPAMKAGGQGDRYTVVMEGQEKYLFFEHPCESEKTFSIGRWFVEAPNIGN